MIELILKTVGFYSLTLYGQTRTAFRKGVRIETVASSVYPE